MPESSQTGERANLLRYASRILIGRPYFRSKLKEKLFLKAEKLGFVAASPLIDSILEDLEKAGYLDDLYLAGAYIRRQLAKGYGSKIISLKLKFLGLDRETINSALLSEATEESETLSLANYCQKFSHLDPRKLASKAYSRGYPGSIIRKVLQYNY